MTTSVGSVPPPGPLSYTGSTFVQFIMKRFPPQDTFNTFQLGTIWLDTENQIAYVLVSKELGVAQWVVLGGAPGDLNTITTPDSVVVVPDAGNINFLNGNNIQITGFGDSITFSFDTNLNGILNGNGASPITGSNLYVTNNTISPLNMNGQIILDPNGSGNVLVVAEVDNVGFNVSGTIVGGTVLSTLSNNDNTNSASNTHERIIVAGSSAGDPFTTYTVLGNTSWSLGVDNSDTDNFVISRDTTLGSNNIINLSPTLVDVINENFRVVANASGTIVDSEVNNSSNTASSDARFLATVQSGTSGDPYITYNVNASQQWSHGIDNSDNDAFVLTPSSALGTGNVLHATPAGQINLPLQPAFSATTADAANVTGNGTLYQLLWTGVFFDQGSNFAGGVFTAPVNGRYQFSLSVGLTLPTGAFTDGNMRIVADGNTYFLDAFNPSPIRIVGTNGLVVYKGSLLINMTAGSTAVAQIQIGGSTQTVGIAGAQSHFSGFLAC